MYRRLSEIDLFPVRRRTAVSEKLSLTMALSDYDHTRDLAYGRVSPEGINLLALDFQVEEIFYRSLKHREFDVCELSFGKYISLISQGDTTFSAIPVFPSRMFRQSSAYVLRDGPVKTVDDLRGRKVGLPEWAQTAAVYSRGFLDQQYGLKLTDVQWVQAGTNEAGREEKVALRLPAGVKLEPVKGKSLNEMLLSGEIAAIFAAHPPHAFEHGDPRVVRLFADYQAVEQAYYEATRIFPIMHVLAIKRPILERNPWVARNLYKAFEEAKARSYARAAEATASRFPIPWSVFYFERARELFGPDPFPYGVEPNRVTLEAFAEFAHVQGVAHRRVELSELFWETMGGSFRV
jgi:4,5-dihydroxyphthalate decarboxylase